MYRVRSGMGIAPAECSAGSFWCKPSTDCSQGAMWAAHPICWSMSADSWAKLAGAVAPVGAPTGAALTVPPASGADAQATVDALVNQQMLDQQAKNAAGVQSSWWDGVLGGTAAAADSAAGLIPTTPNLLLIGGIALAAVVGLSVLKGRR